ncbi:hypothetical protein IWX64_001997 [Arthrobacter sp. CAN_A212]|uniref:hypothetical protein n=1 Tax=Arthrobacter sp. CAN_A212 TaxID=2787719 RepID=UPI0018C918EE
MAGALRRLNGDRVNTRSSSALKDIRSSLGCALAIRRAPLVDMGLTSTTDGKLAAVLGLGFPSQRVGAADVGRLGPIVKGAADQASHSLGQPRH